MFQFLSIFSPIACPLSHYITQYFTASQLCIIPFCFNCYHTIFSCTIISIILKHLTSTVNSLNVKHFWVMIMVKGLYSDRNPFNTQAINKLPLMFTTTTLVSKENHIILKPALVWLMHLVKFFFLQWCSFSSQSE